MLGYPLTSPVGTPAADRPTHLPPPPSRPPKVFASGWGLEFEQAALLDHVVQDIRWADTLNSFYCPQFPFFMTHFTDSMPINSIGGICVEFSVCVAFVQGNYCS